MLWVSRDPVTVTQQYCKEKDIPITETIADPPNRTYTQLGLQFVPRMIVVTSDGVVERVWSGLLDPSQWEGVFAYFGVQPSKMLIQSQSAGATASVEH